MCLARSAQLSNFQPNQTFSITETSWSSVTSNTWDAVLMTEAEIHLPNRIQKRMAWNMHIALTGASSVEQRER